VLSVALVFTLTIQALPSEARKADEARPRLAQSCQSVYPGGAGRRGDSQCVFDCGGTSESTIACDLTGQQRPSCHDGK